MGGLDPAHGATLVGKESDTLCRHTEGEAGTHVNDVVDPRMPPGMVFPVDLDDPTDRSGDGWIDQEHEY